MIFFNKCMSRVMDEAAGVGFPVVDRPNRRALRAACQERKVARPARRAAVDPPGKPILPRLFSSRRDRIDLYSGDILQHCASNVSVSLRPCSSRSPSRYCAASGLSNARIDDLSVIERDSLSRNATLKVLKQPIEDPRRAQLFWKQHTILESDAAPAKSMARGRMNVSPSLA